MIIHNEYLTDEELEQLISEVEADEIVPAPPDLTEHVLAAVFVDKSKKKDFAGYCFRVGMAAAAAVAFIFIMPYLPQSEVLQEEPTVQPPDAREQVLESIYEEYVPQSEFRQEYPTKEEVLKETNFSKEPFGGSDFIKENSYLDIFKKENGGE